jgi:hypothetical protein
MVYDLMLSYLYYCVQCAVLGLIDMDIAWHDIALLFGWHPT